MKCDAFDTTVDAFKVTAKADSRRSVPRFKSGNILRSDDLRGWSNMTTLSAVIRNFSVSP